MAILRSSHEYFGTTGSDNLSSPAYSTTFGLSGDDVLSSEPYSVFNVLAGGSGNDIYNVGYGSKVVVIDTGGIDHIVAPGLGFNDPNTVVATVDEGRHIVVGSTANHTLIRVANWLLPNNSIESIALSDGTYSLSFISSALRSLPNYIGDFPAAQIANAGLFPQGTSSSDVLEFVNHISLTESSKIAELSQSMAPAITTKIFNTSLIVDSGVLGNDPVYLRDLNEKLTYNNGNLVSHTIEYAGTVFNYEDIDPLIMTVTRDDEFTQEFAAEISDYVPEVAGISYQAAVQLLGVQNIDLAIVMVAGADGSYIS